LISQKTNGTCGFSNGMAIANANGGTSPYSYNWGTSTNDTLKNISSRNFVVTVTDNFGCIDTAHVSITNTPAVVADIYQSPVICNIDSGFAFVNITDGTPNYTYIWNNQSQNDTIKVFSSQDCFITITDAFGCTAVKNITIDKLNGPDADFTFSPEEFDIGGNTTANFTDLSTEGSQQISNWEWNFGDFNYSNTTNPSHKFNDPNTYTVWLVITDERGCKDSIEKQIIVKDLFAIYFPNAFSPDNDGKNDFFFPKGYGVDESAYSLIIFNRWGEKIFETNNFNDKWNGRYYNNGDIVQNEVYVYVADVKEMSGKEHTFIGNVTVVR